MFKEWLQLFAAGFVPTISPCGEKRGTAALYHRSPVAWVWQQDICVYFSSVLGSVGTSAQTWSEDTHYGESCRMLLGCTKLLVELDRVLDPVLLHVSRRWRFVPGWGKSPAPGRLGFAALYCTGISPTAWNRAGAVVGEDALMAGIWWIQAASETE